MLLVQYYLFIAPRVLSTVLLFVLLHHRIHRKIPFFTVVGRALAAAWSRWQVEIALSLDIYVLVGFMGAAFRAIYRIQALVTRGDILEMSAFHVCGGGTGLSFVASPGSDF